MKKLSICFWVLAASLSHTMCAFVAYNYSSMVWGIKYAGYSAPAWVALFYAIPFVLGIIICIAFAIFFKKKSA